MVPSVPVISTSPCRGSGESKVRALTEAGAVVVDTGSQGMSENVVAAIGRITVPHPLG